MAYLELIEEMADQKKKKKRQKTWKKNKLKDIAEGKGWEE